jgi:hypothetical protein
LAQAQAGDEQTSQSLGNHRAVLKQAYLRGCFTVSAGHLLPTTQAHLQGRP